MAWSFDMVNTTTGVKLSHVPIEGFSGERALNAPAGGQANLPLTAPGWEDVTKAEWKDLTLPTMRTLVASYRNTPVFAGIVWKRRYVAGSRSVQLTLRDVWSVFENRALIGPASTYPAESKYSFGPASLATIADRVVRKAANNVEPLDDLPIVYPAFLAGTATRDYFGYNAVTIAEALEELIGSNGGPDVDFKPVWNGNTFAWEMGSHPSLNYAIQVDVNMPGGQSGVEFVHEEDASEIITRAFLFGEGTGRKMISAAATIGTSTYLTLERIFTGKRTKSRPILEGWGARTVNRYKDPQESVSLSLAIDGTPGLLDMRPGMKITVKHPGDPWLDGDEHVMRLAGFKFSQGSATVPLDVQLVP